MSTSNSNEQTIFLFFTTGDEAELSEVHRLFRDFRHICVETVLESPLLKGKMSLPFIESPDVVTTPATSLRPRRRSPKATLSSTERCGKSA